MPNDPTQNRSQGNMVNEPAHKEAVVERKDAAVTGLPKQDDEEIIEEESTSEDFVKFNVDKVNELKESNSETTHED